MYKLTNDETIELGTFLRTLCRMDMLSEAKRIAKMHDGHLSILIQAERLWETVDGTTQQEEQTKTEEKTDTRRAPIDFSRPLGSTSK